MASAITQNHQFHTCFSAATQLLQQQKLRAALTRLVKASTIALNISTDVVLGDNARQHYVTTTLILMGVQFRLEQHADTLATYHQLFHQLDDWLASSPDHASQKRLRGYQELAQQACRHLHLERFREEVSHEQPKS